MLEILNINLNQLDALLLMFLRMSGLFFVSTIFGRQNVPNILKAGLAIVVTYLMMIAYPPGVIEYRNMIEYVFMCVKELLFGMILGFVTTVFFSVTFTAGQIIDMQSGFSMVNVLDPQSNMQVPITGNLLNLVIVLCFLAVNGHLRLIHVLAGTLERVPLGQVALSTGMTSTVVEMFTYAFILGINVAMPAIAAGVVVEVALGIMIRTVPQMNMYVVGIPIKIILGFIMMIFILPVFVSFSNTIFEHIFDYIDALIEGMVRIA